MNVFRHKDKSVQFVATFTTVSIQGLQKETCVEFDDEQLSAAVRREGHEISSRRGDESSGLQGETSAAESRASLQSLNWHEWNSCPSRWFFVASGFVLGSSGLAVAISRTRGTMAREAAAKSSNREGHEFMGEFMAVAEKARKVRELHVDFLLEEEFCANPKFLHTFVRAAGSSTA